MTNSIKALSKVGVPKNGSSIVGIPITFLGIIPVVGPPEGRIALGGPATGENAIAFTNVP